MANLRSSRARFVVLVVAAAATACAPIQGSAQVAYAELAVDGALALAPSGGAGSSQDLESAFGLGDERGSPYVRALVDAGVPEFGASGFLLQDSGAGVLSEPFGALPAGSEVQSDLELGNLKLTGAFAFGIGPLSVAPGVLFDVFAIDFRASIDPANREEVDDVVGVPMPFVRLDLPLADLRATAEIGWIDVHDLTGETGRFADIEALLSWQPAAGIQLFAGYRHLSADAEGESGADSVAIDLTVSGWFLGGGISF